MKSRYKLVVAVILTVLGILSQPGFCQESEIGVVTFVKGDVSVIREGKPGPLKVDEKVRKGDVIEVSPGGKARIIFFSEEMKGMKAVLAGEKLDVSQLLAQKPEDRSISSLAADVLAAFTKKQEAQETVATTRSNQKDRKILIFPQDNPAGEIKEVLWLPVPKATGYIGTLEYLGDAGKVTKSYESARILLEKGLPDFQPGVLYTFTLSAFNGKTQIAKDQVTFSPMPPSEATKLFSASFSEVENASGDSEDPTGFLLRGNILAGAGYYSDAVRQYLRYSRAAGKTDTVTMAIRQALFKMKFLPAEVDESLERLLSEY